MGRGSLYQFCASDRPNESCGRGVQGAVVRKLTIFRNVTCVPRRPSAERNRCREAANGEVCIQMMGSNRRCWCLELQGCKSSTERGFYYPDLRSLQTTPDWRARIMAQLSWTQRLYWRYFSKPLSDRGLYQYCIHHPVASILEIGIGSGDRIRQVLTLCEAPSGISQIRYAGVDPFESSTDGKKHMHLKSAHRMLAEFGVKAHLIPGDASHSLSRVAHTVLPSDLIIIDGDWESDSDRGRAISQWLPRLCHAKSAIFASVSSGGKLDRHAPPTSVSEPTVVRKAA